MLHAACDCYCNALIAVASEYQSSTRTRGSSLYILLGDIMCALQ
jgi:hypothetical protein